MKATVDQAVMEQIIAPDELNPSSVAAVERLAPFSAKIAKCEAIFGTRFAAMDRSIQDALIFRRLQQLVGILRVNPCWKSRLDACGMTDVPRDTAEWQQLPMTDRDTLYSLYMGDRPGLVVPLARGGFQIIASGGTSGGLPIETVYSIQELRDTYALAGDFLDRFALAPHLAGKAPKWMVTTLSDYELWSSASMLGGVLQNVRSTNFIAAGPMSEGVYHHMLAFEGPKAILGMSREIEGLLDLGRNAPLAARESLVVAFYGSGVLPPRKAAELKVLYPNLTILSYFASNQAEAIGMQLQSNGLLVAVPGLHFIEIVDDEGRWVGEGEEGELLVTRLHAQHAPVLRVKLGDRMVRRPGFAGSDLQAEQMEFAGRSSDIIHLGESHYSAPRTCALLKNTLKEALAVDVDAVAHGLQFRNNRKEKSLALLVAVDDPARLRAGLPAGDVRRWFVAALQGSLALYDQTEKQYEALASTPYRFAIEWVEKESEAIYRTGVNKTPLIRDVL